MSNTARNESIFGRLSKQLLRFFNNLQAAHLVRAGEIKMSEFLRWSDVFMLWIYAALVFISSSDGQLIIVFVLLMCCIQDLHSRVMSRLVSKRFDQVWDFLLPIK